MNNIFNINIIPKNKLIMHIQGKGIEKNPNDYMTIMLISTLYEVEFGCTYIHII